MTTIADIRRGDQFTWGGIAWYAMDDSRPIDRDLFWSPDETIPIYDVSLVRADKLTEGEDGVIDLGARLYQRKAILGTAEIEIIDRGHRMHHVSEDVREGTPAYQPMSNLLYLMAQRRLAQRQANDLDERRDILIRQALFAGVGAVELAEKTGLTRARIYQIRDGRR